MLLSRAEAAKKIGRSPWTLRDWQRFGLLPVARREGRRVFYDSRHVLSVAKQRRENYRSRPFVPGTGRGRLHPRTDDIIAMIEASESTRDIVSACDCSETTVRRIRRRIAGVERP
ncbi:MAG: MerR family transcriptional regulator [Gordonia polyisoprenivorans]|nr:MerR family transcriptional regulator [Gordonia polyisoprenivorans]